MNSIRLYALKAYLEKQQEEYSQKLSTVDSEIYCKYYQQKLKEVEEQLWKINQLLLRLKQCESDRVHLSKCWEIDSSLGHPDISELNLS